MGNESDLIGVALSGRVGGACNRGMGKPKEELIHWTLFCSSCSACVRVCACGLPRMRRTFKKKQYKT